MTKIYYHPLSFPSLIPVFAAESMGIEHEKIVIDLQAGEQKSEDYLKINPYGKVPAMSDGDFNLSEGVAISRYLALRENSALYSGDLQQQSKIDQWMDFVVQHIRVNVVRVHFNSVLAPMFGLEGDLNAVETGREYLTQNLPHVERQLETNAYLCGDDLSLADIVLLASLEPADIAKIDLSAYPALQALLTSMREETFYTNVHGRYGEEFGL